MPLGMGMPLTDEIDGAPACQPLPHSCFLMSLVLTNEAEASTAILRQRDGAPQYLDVRSALVAEQDSSGFTAGFRRSREAGHFLYDGFRESDELAFRQKDHVGSLPQAGQRTMRSGFPSLISIALRWSIVMERQR